MYIYNYILLVGFACLLFNSRTRFVSAVFLTGWIVYLVLTIDASTSFYYVSSGAIELAIAYTLNNRFKFIAYLSYLLIFVNIYGLLLFKNGIAPISYDVIYAVISITQFILLLTRLIPDGIRRLCIQRITIRGHNFDGGQTCAKMYKTTSTGKKPK